MRFLTREQLSELLPAEEAGFRSPLPTQIVSSDEYLPAPQTLQQRQVEECLKEIGADHAEKQNLQGAAVRSDSFHTLFGLVDAGYGARGRRQRPGFDGAANR